MKKKMLSLVAVVLTVVMLLTGCGAVEGLLNSVLLALAVPFDEMEYVRSDMDDFRQQLENCLSLAQTEENVETLMDAVYSFYEFYYTYYTNYALADIRYCQDMTDIYWDEEYSFCLENSAEVDAGLDSLLYALADSPLREALESDEYFGDGFFDSYEGDSLWDETFTALMNEESELINRYYALNALAVDVDYYSEEFFSGCGSDMEQVFLELVQVRRKIAQYAGYESYPEFAYDFYYYRDYTPEQTGQLLEQIRQELVPLYSRLDSSIWSTAYGTCTEEETYAYVRSCAQALGGTAEDALALMEKAELYDITYSENKYSASFEVYLYDYYQPFIFVSPMGVTQDKLTFVHEFGHFCSDYDSAGSVAGIDVAEIFSQGMEYLSLFYAEGGEELTQVQMANSLCVYVEQAAYASFEHQVYSLEEPTAEAIRSLYGQVSQDFGMAVAGRDSREYVLIPHFFTNPMYVISYVVSNDAALQIYQAEQAESGKGVSLWEGNLATQQAYFLAFLEEAGLESPFAEGRIQTVKEMFEEILQ